MRCTIKRTKSHAFLYIEFTSMIYRSMWRLQRDIIDRSEVYSRSRHCKNIEARTEEVNRGRLNRPSRESPPSSEPIAVATFLITQWMRAKQVRSPHRSFRLGYTREEEAEKVDEDEDVGGREAEVVVAVALRWWWKEEGGVGERMRTRWGERQGRVWEKGNERGCGIGGTRRL